MNGIVFLSSGQTELPIPSPSRRNSLVASDPNAPEHQRAAREAFHPRPGRTTPPGNGFQQNPIRDPRNSKTPTQTCPARTPDRKQVYARRVPAGPRVGVSGFANSDPTPPSQTVRFHIYSLAVVEL